VTNRTAWLADWQPPSGTATTSSADRPPTAQIRSVLLVRFSSMPRQVHRRQVRSRWSAGQAFLTLSDGNACRGEARQAGGLLSMARPLHPESPAHARPALPGSPGSLPSRAPTRGPKAVAQFVSHSPRPRPFTSGHEPLVRAGQGRWRPVVNSGVQSSKACEGASLPWVQIPPPPPLTCKNVGLSS
jgi:hypothetical protein